MPSQFGHSPLQQFGKKVAEGHFTAPFRRLKELEDIEALLEQKSRIQKQIASLEQDENESNVVSERALNLLFRTERSRVFAEDLMQNSGSLLQECDDDIDNSSDRYSDLENEEAAIYNEMHLEAEDVTSGYSTFSSSKEEEYLSCHLANQNAAAIAASKIAKDNQGNLLGLMSSHGLRKGDGAD